jgi:cytochrome c oxidase subunit 2
MQRTITRRSLLLMAMAGAGSLGAGRLLAGAEKHSDEAVIPMQVKRFEYSPRELHVRQGVPVVLEITSLDVPHGFNLPDFNVRADVLPGRVTKVRFVPDRAGTFTFRCDVFCGTGHEELDGELVVTA